MVNRKVIKKKWMERVTDWYVQYRIEKILKQNFKIYKQEFYELKATMPANHSVFLNFFLLIQEIKVIFSSLFIKSILILINNNLEGTPLQNKYIDSWGTLLNYEAFTACNKKTKLDYLSLSQ